MSFVWFRLDNAGWPVKMLLTHSAVRFEHVRPDRSYHWMWNGLRGGESGAWRGWRGVRVIPSRRRGVLSAWWWLVWFGGLLTFDMLWMTLLIR